MPNKNSLNERGAGVFLPISSLPGDYGIGSVGKYARKFVDFLVDGGQKYWQILPLCPTGFGDSPYQSCCSAAGNPYFIDLDMLGLQGILLRDDIYAYDFGSNIDYIDYGKIYDSRLKVLKVAFENGYEKLEKEIKKFDKENSWLHDYSLFMAIKESNNMKPLKDWEDKKLIARDAKALATAEKELLETINFHKFIQYIFWTQWGELREYANRHGIKFIGDLPIYVSEDSVEVWLNPELFQTTKTGELSRVACVPPDAFNADGQLWGNPLYNWDNHEKDGYKWWIARLKQAKKSFDIIRIDHFRGIYSYFSVEPQAKTAIGCKEEKGPRMDFIKAIKSALNEGEIIAEDLGYMEPDLREFITKTELPGMRVLVFGFDPYSNPVGISEHIPHNVPKNCVYYTATHDTPPFTGWYYQDGDQSDIKKLAKGYLRLSDIEGYNWGAIASVWSSPANTVMALFQDILSIGNDGRINNPGTWGEDSKNWCWRVRADAINSNVSGKLLQYTKMAQRIHFHYNPEDIRNKIKEEEKIKKEKGKEEIRKEEKKTEKTK